MFKRITKQVLPFLMAIAMVIGLVQFGGSKTKAYADGEVTVLLYNWLNNFQFTNNRLPIGTSHLDLTFTTEWHRTEMNGYIGIQPDHHTGNYTGKFTLPVEYALTALAMEPTHGNGTIPVVISSTHPANHDVPFTVTSWGIYSTGWTAPAGEVSITVSGGDLSKFNLWEITYALAVEPDGDEFDVTFNFNGGTYNSSSTPLVLSTTYGTVTPPTPIVMMGYDFLGWFDSAIGGTEVTDFSSITSNMTVYAQWDEIIIDPFADRVIDWSVLSSHMDPNSSSRVAQNVLISGALTFKSSWHHFEVWGNHGITTDPWDNNSNKVDHWEGLLEVAEGFTLEQVTVFAAHTFDIVLMSSNPANNVVRVNNLNQSNPGYTGIIETNWDYEAGDVIVSIYNKLDLDKALVTSFTLVAASDAPPPELDFYDVSFNLNGVAGTAPTTQSIAENGRAIKPSNPVYPGFNFLGWFTAATGGDEWNFMNDPIIDNITLYAQWEASYMLNIAQMLSFVPLNNNRVTPGTEFMGVTFTSPWHQADNTVIFPDHYTGNEVGKFTVASNLTIEEMYIEFRHGFDVIFTSSNPNNNDIEFTVQNGSHKVIDFTDWAAPIGEVSLILDSTNFPSSDRGQVRLYYIELAPAESVSLFTVDYNLNGAPGIAPASEILSPGGFAAKPADPTRDGYSFTGWYTAAISGTKWNFFANPVLANTTLYAGWSSDYIYNIPAAIANGDLVKNGNYLDADASFGNISFFPTWGVVGEDPSEMITPTNIGAGDSKSASFLFDNDFLLKTLSLAAFHKADITLTSSNPANAPLTFYDVYDGNGNSTLNITWKEPAGEVTYTLFNLRQTNPEYIEEFPDGDSNQMRLYEIVYTDYVPYIGYSFGDLNADGAVDSSDLAILLDDYGKSASVAVNSYTDIDSDTQIDSGDLSLLLDNYGKTF